MIKFKITREKTTLDSKIQSDSITIIDKYDQYSINTKDLPDLIKALQDKEREIHGN